MKINKIQKIKISNTKHKEYLTELLGNGKVVSAKDDFNQKLDDLLISSTKFDAQPKEYEDDSYTTYDAELKNTTGKDITSLSATVKLKDDSGVVVDTQYLDADSWLKDETTKFEFMTDKQFKAYEIRVSYVDFK